jgi:hypothetical protein
MWCNSFSIVSSSSSSNVRITGSSIKKPRPRRQVPVTLTNLAQTNCASDELKLQTINRFNLKVSKAYVSGDGYGRNSCTSFCSCDCPLGINNH